MNKVTITEIEGSNGKEIAVSIMRNGGGVSTVMTRNQAKELLKLLTLQLS